MKEKFYSLLVSFKVWMAAAASILLCYKQIDMNIWRDVIIALAAARAAVEGINAVKQVRKYEGPVEK